jgi:hypothetical protein
VEIAQKHKRALDEMDWIEHMSSRDVEDYVEDKRVFLVVTPESGPGMAKSSPVLVECKDREQAEAVLYGMERQSPEDEVEVCIVRTTGDSVIEDWFAQADAQMGDPNP